ncbi:MAG: hypothetical protein WCW02_04220 [Candidatus Buchananbacteria bacterium]
MCKVPIKYVVFLLAVFFLMSARINFALAQTSASQLLTEQRTELERQLQAIEQEIVQYQQQLTTTQAQKNTLNNKIKELKTKQTGLTLQIKQKNLQLKKLEGQLTQTQEQLEKNQKKSLDLHEQLVLTTRQLFLFDQYSWLDIFVSVKSFSEFYNYLHAYDVLSDKVTKLVAQLQEVTGQLKDQKQNLLDQKEEQQNYISIINLQQSQLTSNLKDQNSLLQQTKGQEANYQAILEQTKKRAAEIRGRIYSLFGVTTQVTFGEAVQIANWTAKQTGVRAAFLLAVLTQESNLGKNVGTCNRVGDPPEKGWQVIMKPERDQKPFLQITEELGLDPDVTPVSCPMRDKNGNQIGWGGAMGPAQFIPSTWLGYRSKVAALTGKTANPWDIRDAFVAAAIKLKADGAGTVSGEWAAAMKYFSGSTNTAFRFYGDNVVAVAKQYQQDIDDLNK